MRRQLLFLGGLFILICFNWNSPVVIHCIVLLLLWLRHVRCAWVLLQPLIITYIRKRLITIIVNQRLRGLMIIWRVWLWSFISRWNLLVVAALSRLPHLLIIRAIAVCCSHCLSPTLILSYLSSCNINGWRSILLPRRCRAPDPTIWSVWRSLFVEV
jgi:hypothetical protein